MAHLLTIRFSALGDVAMTVPVVHAFATQYPEHELTVLSRKAFAPLFSYMPSNIHFKGVDLNQYRGITGLNRLYEELTSTELYESVADWHNVIRTRYLRLRFRLSGARIAVIDKGRNDKRRLTRHHHKELKPLPTSTQRYADVLEQLGYPVQLTFRSIFEKHPIPFNEFIKTPDEQWIGIAPFAQHKGKIYPATLMEQVIALLDKRSHTRIFLFGGGNNEKMQCEKWASLYQHVTSLVGHGRMESELGVMAQLDLMLSMDSANMHLASIVGTPVVSIWGATHPYAGFTGWRQNPAYTIQTDLPCRPCSIYGKKPCERGDYACLTQITPQHIVTRILQILNQAETPGISATNTHVQ